MEKDINVFQITDVPGTNIYKSISFILLVVLVYIGMSESPNFIPKSLRNASTIITILICLLILFSISISQILLLKKIEWIKKPVSIFLPKIIISISILLFFLAISCWVFFLGGIVLSPFSDLLAVSPIYFIWQVIRSDEVKDFNKIIFEWEKNNTGEKQEIDTNKYIKVIRFLDWSPIIVIILTVTIAEILIRTFNSSLTFINITEMTKSNWYVTVCYIVYFIAVVSTLIAVFPDEFKEKIIKKIF